MLSTEMDQLQTSAELNRLLVKMARSLLQYVGESWPWTGTDHSETSRQLDALVARQQQNIALLVDLLSDREWTIDMGSYSVDFTDLHYLSLDYLLSELAARENSLVSSLEDSLSKFRDDPQALELLEQILVDERAAEAQIKELQQTAS